MKLNVGTIDRAVRVIVGLAVLGAGYLFKNWLGLIGLVPLITGAVRFCPLYAAMGCSTCPTSTR
jgi:hypothetical protein